MIKCRVFGDSVHDFTNVNKTTKAQGHEILAQENSARLSKYQHNRKVDFTQIGRFVAQVIVLIQSSQELTPLVFLPINLTFGKRTYAYIK